MATRPIWLLDVDGVINKIARPNPGDNTGIANADGGFYNMTWRGVVTRFIRDTVESGRAEVRWATTWVSEARQIEELFDLPELPLAFPADTGRYEISRAKLAAANEAIASGRTLIWTDDDAIPSDFFLSISAKGHLPIAPDYTIGLTDADLKLIGYYIDGRL